MSNFSPSPLSSDQSSPTSPLNQSSTNIDRARAHSHSSSATSATSLSSFDLQELDEEAMGPDHVKIAGIDTALESLDIGAGDDAHHDGEEHLGAGVEIKAKTLGGQGEGKDENGSDETINEAQEGEEVDEDDPVYQYTLSLFEYTKRQYMEARWQHERLEREQARGQRSQRSGMEKMAARKAAQQANFT